MNMHECHASHMEIFYTWSHCPLCEAMRNTVAMIGFKDTLENENKDLETENNRLTNEIKVLRGLQLSELERSKFLGDRKFEKVNEVLGSVRKCRT